MNLDGVLRRLRREGAPSPLYVQLHGQGGTALAMTQVADHFAQAYPQAAHLLPDGFVPAAPRSERGLGQRPADCDARRQPRSGATREAAGGERSATAGRRAPGRRGVGDACRLRASVACTEPPPLTGIKAPPIAKRLGFAGVFRHNPSMALSRRLKRTLSWFVAACLLFAQTAAIAYACPRGEALVAAEAAATPCAQHLAGGPGTAGADVGLLAAGNVCEVHCQTPSLPDGGAFDLPAMVVAASWEVPAPAVAPDPAAPAPELEARSAAPPLLSFFPRLLI